MPICGYALTTLLCVSVCSAMKESRMMAKKCTFLNILKATKSHSTLSM